MKWNICYECFSKCFDWEFPEYIKTTWDYWEKCAVCNIKDAYFYARKDEIELSKHITYNK